MLLFAGCDCGKPAVSDDGGVCQAGLPCTSNLDPCKAGVTTCAEGVPQCTDGSAKITGATCGTNQVCNVVGQCVPCTNGERCFGNPGRPCFTGVVECSLGTDTCVDGPPAMAGTVCAEGTRCDGNGVCGGPCVANMPCDTNPSVCHTGVTDCSNGMTCVDGPSFDAGTECGGGVCDPSGTCVSCVAGAACSTNPGGACRPGVRACATGTPECLDGVQLDAGTSCGTAQVCSPTGACVSCSEGTSCVTNAGAPCTEGVIHCGSGVPRCDDAAPLDAGATCGTDQVCNAAGSCVACANGSSCATGNTCLAGTTTCGSGAPVCEVAAPLDAGVSCGTDQVCNGDGGCVACQAGAPCTVVGSPCSRGVTSCASGAPVCVVSGPAPEGFACGASSACVAGECQPNVSLAGNFNLSLASLSPGRSCADLKSYSVTALGTTSTLAGDPTGCLAVGDEVMLINLRGTPAAHDKVGQYELLHVASVTATSVTFTSAPTKTYGEGVSGNGNIGVGVGQQRVAVVRVPHFGNVNIDAAGGMSAAPWDGFVGGVLAFRAGQLTVNGSITMRAKGYREGHYSSDGPCTTNVMTEQGESISGFGTQSTSANVGGSGGIGVGSANFNANTPMAASAGHASAGQAGANGQDRVVGGPGQAYGSADGGLLTMGSGVAGNVTCTGGGGAPSLATGPTANAAGGLVFIAAGSVTVGATGRILADAAPSGRDGAPSGGGVMLRAKTLDVGTGRVTAVGATAIAGSAPTVNLVNRGSDGYVWLFYETSLTGTTQPAAYSLQTPY